MNRHILKLGIELLTFIVSFYLIAALFSMTISLLDMLLIYALYRVLLLVLNLVLPDKPTGAG